MKRRRVAIILWLGVLVGGCPASRVFSAAPIRPAAVTVIWQDLSAWHCNGSATLVGADKIWLTNNAMGQIGSAWSPCKVDLLQDFDFELSVYVGYGDVASDGIAVIFQNDSRGITAIGDGGGGLGYGDTVPGPSFDPTLAVKPSVDVEIDTYGNTEYSAYGEPEYQHLGILENGLFENGYAAGPVPLIPGAPTSLFTDGLEHDLSIRWKASTHTLAVTLDTGAGVIYTKDIINEIFSGITKVYWGLTGATGGSSTLQYFKSKGDDCANIANPTPSPTCTPSPFSTPSPVLTPVSNDTLNGGKPPFVYPNPVQGKIGHLAYRLPFDGKVRVRIYNTANDLSGRYEVSGTAGPHVMELDLRTMAPGVYYLLMEYEGAKGRWDEKPIRIYIPG